MAAGESEKALKRAGFLNVSQVPGVRASMYGGPWLATFDVESVLVLRPSAKQWHVFWGSGVTTSGRTAKAATSAFADHDTFNENETVLYECAVRDLWRGHTPLFSRFTGLAWEKGRLWGWAEQERDRKIGASKIGITKTARSLRARPKKASL